MRARRQRVQFGLVEQRHERAGHPDGLVEITRVDEIEPAQLFLGLGERTVGGGGRCIGVDTVWSNGSGKFEMLSKLITKFARRFRPFSTS